MCIGICSILLSNKIPRKKGPKKGSKNENKHMLHIILTYVAYNINIILIYNNYRITYCNGNYVNRKTLTVIELYESLNSTNH